MEVSCEFTKVICFRLQQAKFIPDQLQAFLELCHSIIEHHCLLASIKVHIAIVCAKSLFGVIMDLSLKTVNLTLAIIHVCLKFGHISVKVTYLLHLLVNCLMTTHGHCNLTVVFKVVVHLCLNILHESLCDRKLFWHHVEKIFIAKSVFIEETISRMH